MNRIIHLNCDVFAPPSLSCFFYLSVDYSSKELSRCLLDITNPHFFVVVVVEIVSVEYLLQCKIKLFCAAHSVPYRQEVLSDQTFSQTHKNEKSILKKYIIQFLFRPFFFYSLLSVCFDIIHFQMYSLVALFSTCIDSRIDMQNRAMAEPSTYRSIQKKN